MLFSIEGKLNISKIIFNMPIHHSVEFIVVRSSNWIPFHDYGYIWFIFNKQDKKYSSRIKSV